MKQTVEERKSDLEDLIKVAMQDGSLSIADSIHLLTEIHRSSRHDHLKLIEQKLESKINKH